DLSLMKLKKRPGSSPFLLNTQCEVVMKNLRILLALILAGSISCSDFFESGARNNKPNQGKTSGGFFPPGFDPNVGSFSTAKMLANIGLHVIAPLTKELRVQSELLEMEIKAACSLPQTDNPEWSEIAGVKK